MVTIEINKYHSNVDKYYWGFEYITMSGKIGKGGMGKEEFFLQLKQYLKFGK